MSERVVRAFAPGNISGVFQIIAHDDPRQMHSLGMGFTVADGAAVEVRRAKGAPATSVRFNGEAIHFPTVLSVVEELTSESLDIDIRTALPLSCGFGLSGASSLAAAYGIDALLGLGRSRRELAMVAHVAEVRNLTGLGDVCAQYRGGCLVKLWPGDPLAAQPLPVREQPIYYRYFSPIATSGILADAQRRERINRAGRAALGVMAGYVETDSIDFDDCIRTCRRFAIDSGLLQDDDVRHIIEAVEEAGGSASMIMLGNAVFSTCPFEGSKETALSLQGASILDD
ncbi:pantoate kinase [Candidatus Latescibacterota bacterium]